MAERETAAMVDRLSRFIRNGASAPGASAAATRSAEEVLGLKWIPRDHVIDVVTGKRATVLSGRRSDATGRGVFVVQLATGELTHRDERELELDQAPAPGPGR